MSFAHEQGLWLLDGQSPAAELWRQVAIPFVCNESLLISRVALEAVGNQFLLRLAAENAVFDILTDATSLAQARELVEAPAHTMGEVTLGSFGPLPVTLSRDATGQVAIALDGPEFGSAVRGNQAVVFYPTLTEAAELFRLEFGAPAT